MRATHTVTLIAAFALLAVPLAACESSEETSTGATPADAHSSHRHELHQYPDRTEQAKHGYGRCLRPPVSSDVCDWPANAQRFMQSLGVAGK